MIADNFTYLNHAAGLVKNYQWRKAYCCLRGIDGVVSCLCQKETILPTYVLRYSVPIFSDLNWHENMTMHLYNLSLSLKYYFPIVNGKFQDTASLILRYGNNVMFARLPRCSSRSRLPSKTKEKTKEKKNRPLWIRHDCERRHASLIFFSFKS
jgi:hypothetical protein